jgi:hypothetical protein
MFHWIIESRRRQVTQLADGDLSWQEYHKLLNVIDGARIHHWRNLFDATDAHLAMTSADLLNLGARIRDQVSRHTMGRWQLSRLGSKQSRLLDSLASWRQPTAQYAFLGTLNVRRSGSILPDDQSRSFAGVTYP